MSRARALPTLSLPLAAAGCLAGHAAAYAIVGTSAQQTALHGYLAFAPVLLAVAAASIATTVGLRVVGRFRGRPSVWPFALLPPLAFLAQELIERLAAGLPAHTLAEPVVLVGLAAQLPLAALAFLVARLLLGSADRIASELPALAPRPLFAALALAVTPATARRPTAQLAFESLGRAPPRR